MTSYPDFICIGAQKAATTWLYDALRWVPGVFLPAIKELHYFSQLHTEDAARFGPVHRARRIAHFKTFHESKIIKNAYVKHVLAQLDHLDTEEVNDDWYRGIYEFASDFDICGEICPSYMNMPRRGIRHVMSINPLMRVIVLVRDPVDRIWSHIRMHAKTRGLAIDIDGILDGRVMLGPFMQYTDYAGSINQWQSMTGEGRFKAIIYDRIGEEPYSVLNEILDFIGAERANTKSDLKKKVFSGDDIKLPSELRAKLFADLQPQYDFLHTKFPDRVEQWVERHRQAIS